MDQSSSHCDCTLLDVSEKGLGARMASCLRRGVLRFATPRGTLPKLSVAVAPRRQTVTWAAAGATFSDTLPGTVRPSVLVGARGHRLETSLDGVYLSSDFCSGRVWGLERGDDGAWIFQELLDTQLSVTGGGNGEAGDVYLTSCSCEFSRNYDPMADPQGAVWRVVQSDKVPDGAETAPPEPAASPAP